MDITVVVVAVVAANLAVFGTGVLVAVYRSARVRLEERQRHPSRRTQHSTR